MGIYISDIEMPKRHNYITITIWSDGVASYGLFNRDGALNDFEDIKIVPVPPHGRLIDADGLIISTAVPLDGKPYQYVHIDNIENAPTIIPAEENKT